VAVPDWVPVPVSVLEGDPVPVWVRVAVKDEVPVPDDDPVPVCVRVADADWEPVPVSELEEDPELVSELEAVSVPV